MLEQTKNILFRMFHLRWSRSREPDLQIGYGSSQNVQAPAGSATLYVTYIEIDRLSFKKICIDS